MRDGKEQGPRTATRFESLKTGFGELIATFNEREKKSTIAINQILPALADFLEIPEEARRYAPPSEGLYPKQSCSALKLSLFFSNNEPASSVAFTSP